MDLRVVVATIALALAVQAAPTVQEPQTQKETRQQPTFRSGAELIRVDATVLDRDGHPVADLGADDFVVEEDGVRQQIRSFQVTRLTGAVDPGDDRALDITSASHAAVEVARDDVRVFLIFWDEYHIPRNQGANLLRQTLVSFVRTMLRPTDLVAVMDQWTPMTHLRFTRDRSELWTTALGLKGRQGDYMPRNVAEENHLRDPGRIEFVRSLVSLSALESAMLHLGTLREGRKTILYFSREFGLGRSSPTRVTELMRVANDNNVAFYAINPDGLDMRGLRRGILSDLAANTGGEALQTNAPDVAIRRAVQQSEVVYLLGYAPEPLRRDGKFHKIKVSVSGKGFQVRSRNGYWAPDLNTMLRAQKASADAVLPRGIETALGELARLEHREDGQTLALRTTFEPEEPTETLHVRDPRLWAVTRPAELRAATSAEPPEPTVEREFARAERLILRVALEGTAAASAAVTVGLVGRQGKLLTSLEPSRVGDDWMVDLPLSSIARGDYVLTVEARAADARAAAYVPIRVKP